MTSSAVSVGTTRYLKALRASTIRVTDDDAWVTDGQFERLREYSASIPTGEEDGLVWKADNSFGTDKPSEWWLREMVFIDVHPEGGFTYRIKDRRLHVL